MLFLFLFTVICVATPLEIRTIIKLGQGERQWLRHGATIILRGSMSLIAYPVSTFLPNTPCIDQESAILGLGVLFSMFHPLQLLKFLKKREKE